MRKTFVLDTSVLLFDHNAITNFEEHDIIIPIIVLEELDQFKIGNNTQNFEARSVIRLLDNLSEDQRLDSWVSLGEKKGRLKILMHHGSSADMEVDAESIFGSTKNDHRIINVALHMMAKESQSIILVTKDINLRLKAKALGLQAEDYKTGKVEDMLQVDKRLPTIDELDAELIKNLYQHSSIDEGGILKEAKISNGYYILNNCAQSALVRYNRRTDQLERVEKKYAFGIKPKNAEQTFAMDALLNSDIHLVVLQGVAGTGKTLLALAAALEQMKKYDQIILSRPIVPLSNRDIGFLPGNAEDKISPYMQPLWDNLKFIRSLFRKNEKRGKMLEDIEQSGQLEITALTFIRGRSLSNAMFIIDEAQNLTPHEVKTIITRAGEGTKIVFTGDINQIDTPYMDEQSNGLSYLIDRFKGNELFAHIRLEKGERSELANLATDLL
ncbi:MAG: PhoH family protein [Saprospiraceae bacterium]|nr:PhoH family protein [Saprospiraceae bacterium]